MLKTTLTAILLSSVSLVPAATIGVLVTADVAHAKSDKAGGNGGGNGASKGNKGGSKSTKAKGGKSKTKTARSNGGSSKSRGGLRVGNDPVGKFIKRVTGQDKKKTRAAKTRTAKTNTAKVRTDKVAKVKDPMHPSNLGNMNGALNANINAVLAHVRNGNTNGPVGHLAALAVANVNADGAQEIVDLRDALDGTPYATVEEYIAARQGVEGIDQIEAIDNAADQEAAAVDAGFDSYQDYLDAVAGEEGIEPIGDLDDAIAALGGNPDPAEFENTPDLQLDPDAVAQAEADLEAQSGAEQDILSYWNKNENDPDVTTDEEQALLDKLNDRLVGEENAIRDAMGEDATDDDVLAEEEGEDEVIVVIAE